MSHESDRDPTAETFPDPVFVHSKRESIELLVAFLVFLIWSVGVSYVLGYGVEVGANETVWGIPHWVFWGCLLYTSPSPRDKRQSRMPSSA